MHRRAEFYYQQFDALATLRQEARRELLVESRKHSAVKLLRQIPSIGPIRAALLVALLQTPHRFRTKRQLWAYIGLALKTYTSGEYRFEGGQLKRSKKTLAIRGLNRNYNHDLKNIFKGQRTLSKFLRSLRRPRDEAAHGTPHVGAQDCRDHFAGLEERSAFQRRISEGASSLSVG